MFEEIVGSQLLILVTSKVGLDDEVTLKPEAAKLA
jgi:hypothetical protein